MSPCSDSIYACSAGVDSALTPVAAGWACLGGAVVNANFVAAVGVTAIAVLFMVPLSPADVSVAVSVHDVPVSMTTLVNAAVPAVAASVSVDPPLKVHVDEITMVSVGEPPAVIFTLKLASVAPAVVVAVGSGEKVKVEEADDAGRTPTSVTPPSKSTVESEARPLTGPVPPPGR